MRVVAMRAATAARAVARVVAAAIAVRVAAGARCLVERGAAAEAAVVRGCSHLVRGKG